MVVLLLALLCATMAFIFYQSKVLKNIQNIIYEIVDKTEKLVAIRSMNSEVAYDGKYYPATVISKMVFDAPADMTLADFSMYDKYKVVGFTIYTIDKLEECYMPEGTEDWDEETKEELRQSLLVPALHKNCIVYSPREGCWRWKFQE